MQLNLSFIYTSIIVFAGKRALVIGNASYLNEQPLVNTLNDANDIASKLRSLGFDVTYLENQKGKPMGRQINRFLYEIEQTNDTALLYFSGHGVQDRSKASYLLPVDAVIKHEADIEVEGISLNHILDKFRLRPENAINLVVIDACRNNPFASKRGGKGLGRVSPASGTMVMYAASPNETAEDNPSERNGLFTKHLLKHIDQSGLEVDKIFEKTALAVRLASNRTQTPYKEGNLLGDYYLAGKTSAPVSPVATNTVNSDNNTEVVFWQSVDKRALPDGYKAYLKKWPNGQFADLARLNLEPHTNTQPEEELIGLFIKPTPSDAKIRILNIGPKFKQGILLKPGKYKVEVSKTDFKPHIATYEVNSKSNVLNIVLKKNTPTDNYAKYRSVFKKVEQFLNSSAIAKSNSNHFKDITISTKSVNVFSQAHQCFSSEEIFNINDMDFKAINYYRRDNNTWVELPCKNGNMCVRNSYGSIRLTDCDSNNEVFREDRPSIRFYAGENNVSREKELFGILSKLND